MIHFEASILSICVDNFLLRVSLFLSSEICSGLFLNILVTVLAGFSGLGGAFYILPNRKRIGNFKNQYPQYIQIHDKLFEIENIKLYHVTIYHISKACMSLISIQHSRSAAYALTNHQEKYQCQKEEQNFPSDLCNNSTHLQNRV